MLALDLGRPQPTLSSYDASLIQLETVCEAIGLIAAIVDTVWDNCLGPIRLRQHVLDRLAQVQIGVQADEKTSNAWL